MTRTAILLYGATGYSGRLIAARAGARWTDSRGPRLVLAGRDGAALDALARALGVEYRVFGLSAPREIDAALHDVGTLVNAAGPFIRTAEPLARAALRNGCHYVDINGEVDVYKRLDDLGYLAEQRGLAIVCGAGHSATASDLLVEMALARLEGVEIGAIRIALSQVAQPSRGSLHTALHSVREQVVIVRQRAAVRTTASPTPELALHYVPYGQLERTFDFGLASTQDRHGGAGRRPPPRATRIASAVNLIDTLTARVTAVRHGAKVQRIESYLETGDAARAALQWAAVTAPLWGLTALRQVGTRQIDLLLAGPTAAERQRERLSVVVDVDDPVGAPLVRARLETPSAYDFTACAAVAVAERVPTCSAGWRTPGEVLTDRDGHVLDPCSGSPLADRVAAAAGRGAAVETFAV